MPKKITKRGEPKCKMQDLPFWDRKINPITGWPTAQVTRLDDESNEMKYWQQSISIAGDKNRK